MDVGKMIGFITLTGAAIQQAIQAFDWPLTLWATKWAAAINAKPENANAQVVVADVKKTCCGIVSFVFGLVVAIWVYAQYNSWGVLKALQIEGFGGLDVVVTAFAIGFGTEQANSASKILTYLKEKANPNLPGGKPSPPGGGG